jgi:beta-lactamase regulating signal transducer with metallopeptidase domain
MDTSINLPAQILYHIIPTPYSIFKVAKIVTVIWYCGFVILILQQMKLSLMFKWDRPMAEAHEQQNGSTTT